MQHENPTGNQTGKNRAAKIEQAKELADERDDPLVSLLVDIVEDQEERIQERNEQIEELDDDRERLRARVDAKTDLLSNQVNELQSRELEKGAHLRADNVIPADVTLTCENTQLERITKEDGKSYFRSPGAEDGLQRGGGVTHAAADLLPLQRLARYDDEMLASVAKTDPDELAAKAWRQRDETGRHDLWRRGSGDVRVFLRSSDLAEWIRNQHSGMGKKWSQELARRTMESMLDLSKNRLCKTRQKHTKDGLTYRELQIELRSQVELPGESNPSASDDPATAAGAGAT